jgi:predicted patatin/cPLA2 family phospholipase
VFGTPAYLPGVKLPEDVGKVKASASRPPVSRMVEIDGHRYLDGGTTDAVPYEVALGLGDAPQVPGHEPARRALVVMTQHREYRKTLSPLTYEYLALRSHRYDGYPYYLDALETRPARYNACRKMVHEMADRGEIVCLEPPAPVEVATSGSSGEKCLTLYLQGRAEAEAHLDEIRAYLAG